MIIAVTGNSSRGAVACQIAKHLKYYLIDQDDITPALQDSFPSSSTRALATDSENLNDLSFKIIYEIASTQLTKLKLGVIISTALIHHHSHFEELKQLANSAGTQLVIIQCRQPQDSSDDYHFEGVQKFTVDSTKPFVAKNFFAEISGKVTKANSTHLHALSFYNNKPSTGTELRCKSCLERISGPRYQCIECDEYIFDRSCAEHVGQGCPDYLRARQPEYRFPQPKRCKICESNNKNFSDGCRDCLFETNLEGKFLPIIMNHQSHEHPLNLIMMPLSYNYKYGCCGCGELGNSISYRCYDCNYNLHVSCVLLPPTASSKLHRHTLTLTYDSLEENYWDKNYCDFCENEKKPEQWFYYCSVCKIVAHMGCCAENQ